MESAEGNQLWRDEIVTHEGDGFRQFIISREAAPSPKQEDAARRLERQLRRADREWLALFRERMGW
jgi:hypothetical protein